MNTFKSVLHPQDLYQDIPPTNKDLYSFAKAIRDLRINAEQAGAKNIFVTDISFKSDRWLVVSNDGNKFDSADFIEKCMESHKSGNSAGSMGCGGSHSHFLLSVDPYNAVAIWAGHTVKDGSVAIRSSVCQDRRLETKRLSKEDEISFFSLLKSINSFSGHTVFVALRMTTTYSILKRDLCDYLDLISPPSKARCKIAIRGYNEGSFERELVSKSEWLKATDHQLFDMNDIDFSCEINDKLKIKNLKADLKFYIFPGLCYKHSSDGWIRLKKSGKLISTTKPYSNLPLIEGSLCLPFVTDPTMSRLRVSSSYVSKNLHDLLNTIWRTNITSIKGEGTKTSENFTSRTNVQHHVFAKPSVFCDISLKSCENVEKSNIKISESRFTFDIFRINKFFMATDEGESNCKSIIKHLLIAAKKQFPETIDEIVKECIKVFPEYDDDELDDLPITTLTNTNQSGKVYFVGDDGKNLPHKLIPGKTYGASHIQTFLGGRLKELDYMPIGPSFTMHRRDTGGYNLSISNYKKRHPTQKNKFISLTEEEFIKELVNQTYPQIDIKFYSPDSSTNYVASQRVCLPVKRTRDSGPVDYPVIRGVGGIETETSDRWRTYSEEVYVFVDGDIIYYNRTNADLRHLIKKKNKSRDFKQILIKEIDRVAWMAYHKCKSDVISCKFADGVKDSCDNDRFNYAANLAVKTLMLTDKVRSKLKEIEHDDDVEMEDISDGTL